MKRNGFLLGEMLIALAIAGLLLLSFGNLFGLLTTSIKRSEQTHTQALSARSLNELLWYDIGTTIWLPPIKDQSDNKPKRKAALFYLRSNDREVLQTTLGMTPQVTDISGITPHSLSVKSAPLKRYIYRLIRDHLPKPLEKVRTYSLYRSESSETSDKALEQVSPDKDPYAWVLVLKNIRHMSALAHNDQTIYDPDPKQKALLGNVQWPLASTQEKQDPPAENPKQQEAKVFLPKALEIIIQEWNDTYTNYTEQTMIIPFMTQRYLEKKPAETPPEKKEGQAPQTEEALSPEAPVEQPHTTPGAS